MKIIIMYPQLLDTGKSTESISGITNFEEKPHGISFKLNDVYIFLTYNHITGFILREDDDNDT